MTKKNVGRCEHSFSIEMGSSRNLSHVSLTNESEDGVLIKGSLGELLAISLEEELVFEIVGTLGVLRLDLNEEELRSLFKKTNLRDQHQTFGNQER